MLRRQLASVTSVPPWWKKHPESSFKSARIVHANGEAEAGLVRFLNIILPIAVLLMSIAAPAMGAESNQIIYFDIPRQRADVALVEFAKQADVTFFFPYDKARQKTANRVVGYYTPDEAIDILLEGTGLRPEFESDGKMMVRSSVKKAMGRNEMSSKKRGFIAGLIAVLTVWSGHAAAQGNQGSAIQMANANVQKGTLEEIVVTARKRQENIQNVPISVSALTGAQMRARSLETLGDIGKITPNFTFNSYPQAGRLSDVVFIRGVGQGDPAGFEDPGVGIYLDGVYMGRMQGIDFNLLDLKRVSVLRGPQGTLFGKNTIGGAVNIITNKPTDKFEGSAELTTGSFNRIDGRATVNLPLIPGTLDARVSGISNNSDGYGERLNFYTGKKSGEMGNDNNFGGRVLVDWRPRDDLNVLFSFDGGHAREAGPVRKGAAFTQPGRVALLNTFVNPPYGNIFKTDSWYTTYATGPNYNNLDEWGTALTVDWDLGNWAIKSITSYRDMKSNNGADRDASIYDITSLRNPISQHQFSQELQFSGRSFEKRLAWLFGLYTFNEDAADVQSVDVYHELLNFTGQDFSFTDHRGSTDDSYAAFGQGTYSLTDKLDLTGGLRYTYEEKKVSRDEIATYTGVLNVPYASRNGNWDAVTWRVSLGYHWNPVVMTYASIASGFKSGGINARSSATADFLPFKPEHLLTYEVGLKSELLDGRLLFDTSLYYSDYTDIQFSEGIFNPVTSQSISVVGNVAQARIMGFEMDAVAAVTPALTLTADIGNADAKYTKVGTGTTTLPITTHTHFIETPKWTATLSGQYVHSIPGLGTLTGRLDYTYKTKVYHQISNVPVLSTQPGYGLLNARLTLQTGNFTLGSGNQWALSLFGTNLTNKKYILTGQDRACCLGWAEVIVGPPREWGLDVRYTF